MTASSPDAAPSGDASDSDIVLTSGRLRARFSPADGGRLCSFAVDDRELLVAREDNPMGWGSYPMVPWAGRVADGRFSFDGAEFELPITLPPHAIHGTAYVSSWAVDHATSTSAQMSLELGEPWPLGGRVVQKATVDETGLRLELAVSAGAVSMPVMAGWHPWFRRQLDDAIVELTFGPARVWELDARAIPTGRIVDAPDPPWDHCFTELASEPTLTWSGAGEPLVVRLTSNCTEWVIYTPDHAVCVEPQTSAPDSFNRSPDVVGPGESLVATFELTIEESWHPKSPGIMTA